MDYIFEILDKTGRRIRLTKKQWSHMMRRHPYMEKYIEEIKEALKVPDKIMRYPFERGYYYKSYKHLKSPNRLVPWRGICFMAVYFA